MVTVRPTHRRRGLLRRLIQAHFDDCRERGEALSGLWASESSIYGRFGYGDAAPVVDITIDGPNVGVPPATDEVHFVDIDTARDLLPPVYDQLRRAAELRLAGGRDGHTLSATALVHEAYVRMARQERIGATDRVQFLSIAGTTMRRVLVDWARAQKRAKRGAGAEHVALNEDQDFLTERETDEVLALDDALTRLAAADPRSAQAVELRFFGGLNLDEAAEVLQVSRKTVQRDWIAARAWLKKEIDRDLAP